MGLIPSGNHPFGVRVALVWTWVVCWVGLDWSLWFQLPGMTVWAVGLVLEV